MADGDGYAESGEGFDAGEGVGEFGGEGYEFDGRGDGEV
jgi:hypothetical protein